MIYLEVQLGMSLNTHIKSMFDGLPDDKIMCINEKSSQLWPVVSSMSSWQCWLVEAG